jgi:hypothetical protein
MGIYDRDYMRNRPSPEDYEKQKKKQSREEHDKLLEQSSFGEYDELLKKHWKLLRKILIAVAKFIGWACVGAMIAIAILWLTMNSALPIDKWKAQQQTPAPPFVGEQRLSVNHAPHLTVHPGTFAT